MKPIISPKIVETSVLSVDFENVDMTFDIPFERPVYEDLLYIRSDDGVVESVSSQSLLLNTKRLENSLGADVTRKVIDTALDNLRNRNPSLSSQLPVDFDFETLIKDRNIQTPSELQSWIEYNQSVMDRINEHENTKVSWQSWFAKYNKFDKSDKKDDGTSVEPKNNV
nr:MAG TPA: hypothetical protein [Microviridae sp.]